MSSVKKLFNILDAHLDIYCWLLKKEVGVAALMELEHSSALHSHILEQNCAAIEAKICQVLEVFVEIINRKKKFRMWFKSFDRVCDVLKYGESMGSLNMCLELISCSIVIEYDEQQCEYRQLFSEYQSQIMFYCRFLIQGLSLGVAVRDDSWEHSLQGLLTATQSQLKMFTFQYNITLPSSYNLSYV